MKLTQIQQMITTLGIDQNSLMQYIQENFSDLSERQVQDMKQPVMEMLEKMDLNFYQKLQMYAPMVNTHRDISYSTDTVQLHSHSFYELLYCESGNIQYLIKGNRYSIKKGDIILVPPGISHRPIFHEELKEPYSRIVLWISSEYIQELIHKIPDYMNARTPVDHYYVLRTNNTKYEYLHDYFLRGVTESAKKTFGWEAMLFYNTGQLVIELYRIVTNKNITRKTEKEDELDRILSYIESNYKNKISLDDAAREFLISKSTLSKLFQNRLNISFYRYVTQRRLINAKKRIEKGESLDKLGISCGFNDYATFYRAFKKEYGLTPREYQKLII